MNEVTSPNPSITPPPAPDPELAADERALTILSTEHWGLLTARSLAYNESFTRANMYLAFISLSFVGLALLAQALGVTREFLAIAAVVLAFDFLIGLSTSIRSVGATLEDARATQGMNRIRQAYVRISPRVLPFLTTGIHDDMDGIRRTYSLSERDWNSGFWYGFSTSGAVLGLITALVAGAFVGVIAAMFEAPTMATVIVGSIAAVIVFGAGNTLALRAIMNATSRLDPRFPTPPRAEPTATPVPRARAGSSSGSPTSRDR